MTTREMIIGVQLAIGQLQSQVKRDLQDEEILWYLNKAQDDFILSKVRKKDNNDFQYDIVDAEAIDVLIEDAVNLPLTNNETIINLPVSLNYYVRGALITKCGIYIINFVKSNLVDIVNNTPYYNGKNGNVKRVNAELTKNRIKLTKHKNLPTIKETAITYIRKPSLISLTSSCELRDRPYHQAIVDLTVERLMVDTQNPNSQPKKQDNLQHSITIN